MAKFRERAAKTTSISPLMEGKTKLKTGEIIRDYPQGVTIIGFDIVPGKEGSYPIFVIAEDPGVFFSGGTVLQNIVSDWMEDYGTDIDQANADLKAEGGVKIRLEQAMTRAGRQITRVTVL